MDGIKKQRPLELNIIIGISLFSAITSIIVARYYIINQDVVFVNINKEILSYFMVYIYIDLLISFVQIIVTYGLFKGFLWAWYLAIIGSTCFLFLSVIISIFIMPDIFSILLNSGFLYLLNRNSVKNYFKN